MRYVALLLLLSPERYQNLPPERVCQTYYDIASRDVTEIARQMDLCDGWTRDALRERRCEAEKVRQVWFGAWWLQWRPQHDWKSQFEDLEYWEGQVMLWVGRDQFWRGDLPLPLSLR